MLKTVFDLLIWCVGLIGVFTNATCVSTQNGDGSVVGGDDSTTRVVRPGPLFGRKLVSCGRASIEGIMLSTRPTNKTNATHKVDFVIAVGIRSD